MTDTPATPSAAGPGTVRLDTRGPHAIPGPPSGLLMECLLSLIAPLLMAGCTGDIGLARLAAIEVLAAYQARSQGQLVTAAQIVAFALAALDNLRLSAAADLSLSMKLRLRGGANALNRSAQQNSRALDQARCDDLPHRGTTQRVALAGPSGVALPENAMTKAESPAATAHAQTKANPTLPRGQAPRYAATQAAPNVRARQIVQAVPAVQAVPTVPTAPIVQVAPTVQASPLTQPGAADTMITGKLRNNIMWVNAMHAVAAEIGGNLASVPATLREGERLRAAMLTRVATELAAGTGPFIHEAGSMRSAATTGAGNDLAIPTASLAPRRHEAAGSPGGNRPTADRAPAYEPAGGEPRQSRPGPQR